MSPPLEWEQMGGQLGKILRVFTSQVPKNRIPV